MKIQYGAAITDSRGSLDGTTFTNGPFGPFARSNRAPKKKLSARSSLVRSRVQFFSQRWYKTLLVGQRNDWRALALANPRPDVFGNAHALNGLQLYIGANQLRAQVGLPLIDDAPLDQAVTPLTSVAITPAAPDTVVVDFTPDPLPDGHRLYLFATPNLSPGMTKFIGKFAFLAFSDPEIASPYEAGANYAARFGALIATKQIAIRATTLRDDGGVVAVPLLANEIVA